MNIEINCTDTEVMVQLREISDADPDHATYVPMKQMGAGEMATLIVENYTELSTGTALLIAALKINIRRIEVTRDGVVLSGKEKEDALSGKS